MIVSLCNSCISVFKRGIGNLIRPNITKASLHTSNNYLLLTEIPSPIARESPLVEIHPREPQTVRVGESAMLSCRAIAGIPSPTVVWHRRDQSPFSERIHEEYPGTILITDISLGEAGDYECRASNIAGEVSQTVPLYVQQPPTVTLRPDVQELKLTEGDELKLECEAEGIPAATVHWQEPSEIDTEGVRRLPAGSSFGLSAHAAVQKYNVRRADAGTYVCHASNAAGTEQKYITVVVETKRGDVGELPLLFHSYFQLKFLIF